MDKKFVKNQDSKKVTMGPKGQPSKTSNRKGENPVRFAPITELCSGSGGSSTQTCRNSACRAVLSFVDTFCKRCSCCICHMYDDNKDPSLWLECTPDSPARSCGLSCHIECALQHRKVGVVSLGQMMQLDGSYSCASCGNVSEILGFWKKQLTVAKDCRRVNDLCYRVHVCFRILDGSKRYLALHNFVKRAKDLLETEVGSLGGVNAKLARGIVSRLSAAAEVQALCNAAIQKADEVSATPTLILDGEEGSVPAACKFNDNKNNDVVTVPQNEGTSSAKNLEPDSGFKVQDHGKTRQLTWVDERGDKNKLDLNIATVPDLEEDVPPNDSPRDEANHRSGGSENWAQHGPNEEVAAVDSLDTVPRERPASAEAHDSDSAMLQILPLPVHREGPDDLDQNYEYSVTVFRRLEREGHITPDIRLKLFTWFSLRSTQKERRVVYAYIRTLGDDPPILAEQLAHSFGNSMNNNNHHHHNKNKRPRT